MGARSSERYLRRRTMLRIFLLALLCAAVTATPLGSDFEEALPQEGEFQLPEAFIEESGPWVPPASGWEGANACARRFEDVAVNSWKKVKGAKWNKIKGFCRGALRFCALYKKFAKMYNAPALLYAAKPHCRKAEKFHKKLWKAARKAERKARHAKRRKWAACMKNKRCRRAHFRRMRRAEHGFPPVSVGRWRGYVAKHRKCIKNKTCRRRYRRFRRGHRARKKARKGKPA